MEITSFGVVELLVEIFLKENVVKTIVGDRLFAPSFDGLQRDNAMLTIQFTAQPADHLALWQFLHSGNHFGVKAFTFDAGNDQCLAQLFGQAGNALGDDAFDAHWQIFPVQCCVCLPIPIRAIDKLPLLLHILQQFCREERIAMRVLIQPLTKGLIEAVDLAIQQIVEGDCS